MSLEGQQLGEFAVLERLGQGAMGAVYKARQKSLQRTVAIKTLKPALAANPEYIARFHREAIAAAGLNHPNLVQVISAGESEGLHWFAMEYVEGESVRVRLQRKGRLDPREAMAIVMHVATALEYGWRKAKLIHRDIKPDNIFLSSDGEVKLGDLGLAKSAGQEQGLTTAGASMGTPHYMAPEQVEGSKDVDLRADIYSLGCTLYHLVAGQPPYVAQSALAIMAKQLRAPVPDLRSVQAECPVELATAVGKMMRKLPAERPQNYGEVLAELRQVYEDLRGTSTHTPSRSLKLEERFRVIQPLGETNIGRVFHAKDLKQLREVRLFVLHEELVKDFAACAALEREAGRLKNAEHANLLRVFAFENFQDATVLATEWTNGFSLLELLRARRQLDADEALLLLRQAAAGVDDAVERELTGFKFGLEQVLLDFAAPFEKETLLQQALSQWPAWTLKIHPLGWNRDLQSSETWMGSQTLVGGAIADMPGDANAPRGPVRSLASVMYELLGGIVSPGMQGGAGMAASRYTPLSTLTEKGNEVLQRALDPASSFPSAQKFFEALAQSDGTRDGSGPLPGAAVRAPGGAQTAATGKKRGVSVAALMSSAVAMGAITAALIHFAPWKKSVPATEAERHDPQPPAQSATPIPSPASVSPSPRPAATHPQATVAHLQPRATPVPTPPTPRPTQVPKPTPKPAETPTGDTHSPVSKWKAPEGPKLILKEDGVARRGVMTGTWTWTDQPKRVLSVTWTQGKMAGDTISLTMSADGETLTGRSPSNQPLSFTRDK